MPIFSVITSGRVDKVLASMLNISRNQVEKLIKDKHVSVNGKKIAKTSFKVEVDDEIMYEIPIPIKKEKIAVDFDVEILYEDDYLLVVNKPCGLVVHGAPSVKEATLVDWLVAKGISLSTLSGEERHGIVHRIDKETTGALVIAKDNKIHQALSEQLQDKSMGRYYLALIDCSLKEDIIVNKPIGRNPKNRLKMDIISSGREAKTAFKKLLESPFNVELIVAKLFTGRTHQIRVHLNSLGRHILGDTVYGFKVKREKVSRVYLHAYLLYLVHPHSGEKMQFVAPLFDDMKLYLSKNFNQGDIDEKINPLTLDTLFNHI